jgi:alkyl sulfatase BDS1-like metallo-beta-lactamase superfamily hydrolase
MKKFLCLAVLICVFAFTSTAAAYEPEPPPYDPATVAVEPTLLQKYTEFYPPAVIKVTDGVWVARGYNRDNPTLIEGINGLIVVDPGESILAAQTVKDAFNAELNNIFEKKPVKAVIYTHHHDCHVNGTSVFADKNTEIIGHENLLSSMFSEWFGSVFPSRAEGALKMGGMMFMNSPVMKFVDEQWQVVGGWYVGYGIAAPQILGDSGFMPPTKTIKENTRMTIAGVDVELKPVAGETQDVLLVWLPGKKVLIEIAILYEAFPAVSTMRGSRQRDPLDYVNSLKIARSLNPEYLVAIHGPNPVTSGADAVREYLTNFSDAIQFVNDQTVQYLNRGYTAGEMLDLIQLPPHLASSPYLREVYGAKNWNIVHIFRYYRGYYTGEVRDLFPQTTESEAEMSAFLVDSPPGADLAAMAEQARLADKLEWALRIADDALVLDPENADAKETKKKTMIALAEGTMNSQARNMLLSDYLLLTDQASPKFKFGNPMDAFRIIDDVVVPLMPMDTLNRIMAVNLNASRSLTTDMVVGLQLTDVKTNDPKAADYYRLNVRKGVFEVNPPTSTKGQFVIVTDSLTWKQLVLGKLTPEYAVENDMVSISGGTPESFYAFMDFFEYDL